MRLWLSLSKRNCYCQKTGRIPSGYRTSLVAKYRKDSQLITYNIETLDTTINLIQASAYCEISQVIWTGKEFKEIN